MLSRVFAWNNYGVLHTYRVPYRTALRGYHHCPPAIHCPTQAFAGTEDLLPLPGSTDEANPTTWVQVAGDPVSFDATTGARISSPSGSAAVFALTEGSYFCMLVESDGEAALFDAPEGEQKKS